MVSRAIENEFLLLCKEYPIVTVTGPRQSGKTTLAKKLFSKKPYTNFENPLEREAFSSDPTGFLQKFSSGAIFNEVQHLPELLSHLQVLVDQKPVMGQFILTGSQNIAMLDRVTQSLAGRTAILELLPFSLCELRESTKVPKTLEQALFQGGYPPIYDRELRPRNWIENYVTTYIQRDVRSILQIKDLDRFIKFLSICAGQIGQILNYSTIGNACGIDHKTVQSWLSVLRTSHIVEILPPYHQNFKKRLIKSPKLYFKDTGIVSYLLGIEEPDQLRTHPLRGSLFENFVFTELLKQKRNQGKRPNYYFWRTHEGDEINFVEETALGIHVTEVKSTSSFLAQQFTQYFSKFPKPEMIKQKRVIYGGNSTEKSKEVVVQPWNEIMEL